MSGRWRIAHVNVVDLDSADEAANGTLSRISKHDGDAGEFIADLFAHRIDVVGHPVNARESDHDGQASDQSEAPGATSSLSACRTPTRRAATPPSSVSKASPDTDRSFGVIAPDGVVELGEPLVPSAPAMIPRGASMPGDGVVRYQAPTNQKAHPAPIGWSNSP
jgi:hypothetical protein